MPKEILKNIGEKELIKRLSKYMPNNQIIDDCAFLRTNQQDLLINTDLMVENTHFNNKILTPRDIGWKSVTANLSDLLSSGCNQILGITIGLVLTSRTEWEWVKELYEGINEALFEYGGSILGGDCSSGKIKTICITAFGIQGKLKLRRYACKPGEVLLTTGFHGLSKLGFMLKSESLKEQNLLTQKLKIDSEKTFCRPRPNVAILDTIIKSNRNQVLKEIGCTDSSDGLYQALSDLATASNCTTVIDYLKIPKHESWPTGDIWNKYYLFGGEDYELVFSLPKEWARELIKKDQSITEIGFIKKGKASVELMNFPNNYHLPSQIFSHF